MKESTKTPENLPEAEPMAPDHLLAMYDPLAEIKLSNGKVLWYEERLSEPLPPVSPNVNHII